MSALQKLVEHINAINIDMSLITAPELYEQIIEYKKVQDDRYKELKKNNKITFGKYKGFTVKELCKTLKGKDYLRWLLTQTWFTEKFTDLIEEMEKYGIKKKQ